jgi:hypothetical protein
MSTTTSFARAAARSVQEAMKAGASLSDILRELGMRSVGVETIPTRGRDIAPQDQVLASSFDKGRIDAFCRDEADFSVC